MQKQLTKQALVLLLASLLAKAAIGQDRGAALARVPDYSDEPSGWVRVEVAVFADSNAAALNAETWEHAPTLRYPESRRWLTRYDEIKALMDEWGESSVTVNADGSIDVVREPVIEPLPEDSLELSNNPDVSPNSASVAPSSVGSQVSMEELLTEIGTDSYSDSAIVKDIVKGDSTMAVSTEVLDDNVDTAEIDADDGGNTGNLADASAQFGNMTAAFPDKSSLPGSDINWLDGYAVDEEEVEDTDTIAPEEAPPALPTPFQALAVEMLKQGLDKLQRQANRAPVIAVAWLQAPGNSGAPIVLDAWQQASTFPVVQGTLTFARDSEATVTVDLWLNTIGDYLPPRFEAIETPSAPKRVLIIETPPTNQQPTQDSEVPEFIDLRTGLNTDGSASRVDEYDATIESAEQTSILYRHAIAVSEQRNIREGYVRYIDHPALQVVAAWRELSFKEVYELGESQRIRRDIDSLTRTLTAAPKTAGPKTEGP